jgi:subtilisin family serine protease
MMSDCAHRPTRRLAFVLTLAASAVAPIALAGAGARPERPADAAVRATAPERMWVFFTDKGLAPGAETSRAVARLHESYAPRAIARRQARRTRPGVFDATDLPVAERYVDAVEATGARRHVESRWLNGISAWMTPEQTRAVSALPFVRAVEPVRRGRRIEPPVIGGGTAGPAGGFYGLAEEQLAQINLIALHEAGATGAGVVVGILDTGFQRDHVAFHHPDRPLQVIAEWDFVDGDGNTAYESGDPDGQNRHGTLILGTLGAYAPGSLVGAAYDAEFILAKTEDTTDEYEGEEDNYVAGIEFIEANGGDVATSSLGYIDWYTQDDLDGETAVTTIAVNIATGNGLHFCTAAGNSGHDDDPSTSALIAPGDAYQVLTCGAVSSEGSISGFSSDGPSADGRVKPEVLARGSETWTVRHNNPDEYRTASGTSLSTPLVAGAVACIVQAQPTWTVDELRQFLFLTADHYVAEGTHDPDFVRGYGIIDAFGAVELDCNGNGVLDTDDITEGTSDDVNSNGIPDECECLADVDGSGAVDVADLVDLLAAWGTCPDCPEDLDGNGAVDVADLVALLAGWGPCPE